MVRRDLAFNTPNGTSDEESGVEIPCVMPIDEELFSFI